ncbi:ATP-dependent Clp protease proteolytic subunit [Treponema denticola]|uniref:ATP-dependent Clp protease proteolytic subunit 2 n=3 Tax=Treponema denticola TaxID=158 RepID=CLPP2_TREDE|nr:MULTISPECIES: ATP-dependent Clp protease proteolytic subunit [Treponema]Q73JM9.1 RecName: Full=ATP-dependent Clp protease proteolytic subunit 2; AltName: Full=Endopeptidase Clp 2 [Treponema denticola ATCC 35405]AAS12906.1 ATP-dependent Clp protease, proteolytic subunit ClpP [Treponema denticola ATCC 35405]EGC78078.1 ATP-dependent Clp protease proteolytic subunit 2 [Treponema denticola F0402]EMB23655.1 ATP-dependent Clp protease proteolytic subunit 2 [Treponema denticola OTK]EMB26354.1 ATP-d
MNFINETNEEKKNKTNDDDALMQKFLNTRQIILAGEINKELSEKIVRQLLLMESLSATKPIYIYIDSPGGDADAGFAIFDMIRFIKAPVYTIGMGLVASAASIILLAASKERRFGMPNSHYLIHQPLSGIKGVATEIEIHAKELEKMRVKINKLIAEETGTDEKKVAKDTDRDCWLNAKESVEYGLISKIAKNRKDIPEK